MYCWLLFCFGILICMCQLRSRDLHGVNWIIRLHGLHGGVLLRHHRTIRSDWCLFSRYLFSGIGDRLFCMSCWLLFCFGILICMCQLRPRGLHGVDWIIRLHGLHGGVLLRHHRTIRSDWHLFRRDLFSGIGDRLLSM